MVNLNFQHYGPRRRPVLELFYRKNDINNEDSHNVDAYELRSISEEKTKNTFIFYKRKTQLEKRNNYIRRKKNEQRVVIQNIGQYKC